MLDLSNMTFEQLFKNSNRPVGVLFTNDVYADWPGVTPAHWNHKYVPVDNTVYLDMDSNTKVDITSTETVL